MKKFFKSLMAVTLAVVLSNVGGTVAKAEAGNCPPHGKTYEQELSVRTYDKKHYVKKNYYVYDEFGNVIDLSTLTGKTYYEACIITFYEGYVSIRCTKCNTEMSRYYSIKQGEHSICDADY